MTTMRVTFFSNLLHHHQIPFCDEMYKRLGDQFTFVSTIPFPEKMLEIGYKNLTNSLCYNLSSFESEENYHRAIELGVESDVVIIGGAPDVFIDARLTLNKLTFRYSERFFKQISYKLFHPLLWKHYYYNHFLLRNKNVFMLCASAYQANDCKTIRSYKNKTFKWGYFTKVEQLDIDEILASKPNKELQLLWVARFLPLKHPELAIKAALILKRKGYNFKLNMIGTGQLYGVIGELIDKYDLANEVVLMGSMDNESVIQKMKKSHIFIFTSDRNEGWGAVLNEAMSVGCVPIASHKIGAVPYLIQDGENGLIFKSQCAKDLASKIELLIQNHHLRQELSKNAYSSMLTTWSPKVAASNFMILSTSLMHNKIPDIDYGPCSIAEPVKINI